MEVQIESGSARSPGRRTYIPRRMYGGEDITVKSITIVQTRKPDAPYRPYRRTPTRSRVMLAKLRPRAAWRSISDTRYDQISPICVHNARTLHTQYHRSPAVPTGIPAGEGLARGGVSLVLQGAARCGFRPADIRWERGPSKYPSVGLLWQHSRGAGSHWTSQSPPSMLTRWLFQLTPQLICLLSFRIRSPFNAVSKSQNHFFLLSFTFPHSRPA